MKVLGAEEPSWLRCLLNIVWKSGRVPKEWQTAIAVLPLFKKGDHGMCANYRLLSLSSWGSLYQDNGRYVHSQTTYQLFTLAGILEKPWDCLKRYCERCCGNMG